MVLSKFFEADLFSVNPRPYPFDDAREWAQAGMRRRCSWRESKVDAHWRVADG
jgi:hypothetical protein